MSVILHSSHREIEPISPPLKSGLAFFGQWDINGNDASRGLKSVPALEVSRLLFWNAKLPVNRPRLACWVIRQYGLWHPTQ